MNRQDALRHLRAVTAAEWMAHMVTCVGCCEETCRLIRAVDPETAPVFCEHGQALIDRLNSLLEL